MYIDTIVKRFDMKNSKKGFILMRHGIQIIKEYLPKKSKDRALMEKIMYSSTIGFIMYVLLRTRLDATCSLSVTSKFQANADE